MDLATYQRHLFALLFAPCDEDAEPSVAALANDRGAPARWRRYRRMVRDRLEELVENSFPRLRAALGDAWPGLVGRWLAEAPPATPYLRDVHGELARFLEGAIADRPEFPPWAADLARYERALLEVSYVAEEQGARAIEAELGAFAMDRPAALTPAHQILRCSFAVHRLTDDGDPTNVVRAEHDGGFALCVYRDPTTHAVRVLELGAFAAALLEGVARDEGRPLVDVVREAAARSGEAIDAELIAAFAALVADLMERSVWLGVARERLG